MTTPDELANQIVTAAQNDSRINALNLATNWLRQWQLDIELREIDRCAMEWNNKGTFSSVHHLSHAKNC